MGNKKIFTVVGVILAVSLSALIFCSLFILSYTGENPLRFNHIASSAVPPENMPAPRHTIPEKSFAAEADALQTKHEETAFADQMVRELQKYYGSTISEISTQASLLSIRNSFFDSHPENGKALFYEILKRAFPDIADNIIMTLNKLDQYHQWLEDNDEMLAQLSENERKNALWEKRIELFGDDAAEIWTDELLATQARTAKMQDTLAVLNESYDTLIEEKLEVYQGFLRETYEGSPEEYLLNQKDLLSKVFFTIDSVQHELKQLSPEERQWKINQVRREMGFSEEQVDAMGKRDKERNQRWENGLNYMQAREEIFNTFEEAEQGEKLKALREQYFGKEAKTIELEEKQGFFRYNRPHIYGRN